MTPATGSRHFRVTEALLVTNRFTCRGPVSLYRWVSRLRVIATAKIPDQAQQRDFPATQAALWEVWIGIHCRSGIRSHVWHITEVWRK